MKSWCFWIVVLGKAPEIPLDYKEIKPVCPKENQVLIFIGRTDAEAEAPIFWPTDAKNWLIWKDPVIYIYIYFFSFIYISWRLITLQYYSGPWCWDSLTAEEKGMTEDEMGGWYHQLNGHEFEQALGDGGGQGNLVCCSPWGCKESDTTEQLKTNRWWGGQGYTGRLALTYTHYCIQKR